MSAIYIRGKVTRQLGLYNKDYAYYLKYKKRKDIKMHPMYHS